LIIISPILITNYQKLFKVFKKHYLILVILSLLGIAGFNTVLYFGLTLTTATNALIINSSIPILIIIFSYFILKQKILFNQLIGILLSTLGVLYLILQGHLQDIILFKFNQGDILIIISSILWALYSVIIRFKPKELNDYELFSTIVFLGLLFLAPFYLSQGYSLKKEITLIYDYYYIFIYISIFTSILSYYFWHYGINKIGASKTGQFTHLMPIFGSFLAYLFLDEKLQTYHIVGIIFIASGIYLSLFYKKEII